MSNKHGGKRDNAGRKRFEPELQKRRNITLCDRLAEKAKLKGNNNISEGIRIALESLPD